MARLGTIGGLHAGLTAAEREEIFLGAVTGEALASFAIEGAPLSPAEIEASVIASLAHRQALPQRRHCRADARGARRRSPLTASIFPDGGGYSSLFYFNRCPFPPDQCPVILH